MPESWSIGLHYIIAYALGLHMQTMQEISRYCELPLIRNEYILHDLIVVRLDHANMYTV